MLKNILKKLTAAVCASAVLIQASAFALADGDGVYYNDDFSSFTDGTLVNMNPDSHENKSYEGYEFWCGTRAEGDYGQISISADSGVIKLDVSKYANAARTPKITLTNTDGEVFSKDIVIKLKAKFSAAGEKYPIIIKDGEETPNKLSYYITDSALVDQWLDIDFVSRKSGSMIIVKKDDEVLDYQQLSGTLNGVSVITMEDAQSYSYSIDSLYIADETYVLPDSIAASGEAAALEIDTSQRTVKKNSDGNYVVSGDFRLPETTDTKAVLTWTVSQKPIGDDDAEWVDSGFIKIDEYGLAEVGFDDGFEDYILRLRAAVDYNGSGASKDFYVTLDKPVSGLYYNDDFSGIADGTLVNMQYNSNTIDGYDFHCGTRSGDYDKIAITADSGVITFKVESYASADRTPSLTLLYSQNASFKNDVVVRMSASFSDSNSDHTLILKDSKGNSLSYYPKDESLANQMLDITFVSKGDKSYIIVYNKDDIVDYAESNTVLSNAAVITMKDAITYSFSLDSLYICDMDYIISDDVITGAANHNLDLDTTQYAVTKENDGSYTIIDDFKLPLPNPSKANIKWYVDQKNNTADADSENSNTDEEDTSSTSTPEPTAEPTPEPVFITFSGNNAVINPTDEISEFDIKLVADITYGDSKAEKKFSLNIKTPQEVVDGKADLATVKDIRNRILSNGDTVSDNLTLYTGDTVIPVKWQCYILEGEESKETESDIISSSGIFTPTDYTGNIILRATSQFKRAEAEKEYTFKVNSADKVAQDIVDTAIDAAAITNSSGATVSSGATITSDLILQSETTVGSKTVPITWQCYQTTEEEENETDDNGNVVLDENGEPKKTTKTVYTPFNVITPAGVFMPTDYAGDVVLRATASYDGRTAKKEYELKVRDAESMYINPTISKLKAKSADNTEITEYADYDIDMRNIGTINYDLQLPTSVSVSDGKVEISWKALTDNITITDKGVAQYTTSDFNEHEAKLEGTFTYVKNGTNLSSKTPESFDYKVQFTEADRDKENTLGKYKVRFDSAYDANFASIPSQTSTDITLPTTGYFGSTISWSSNSPGIISASGKFTQPVSATNVVLNATVTAPDTSETGSYSKTVTVYGTGISSGGSSGGRVSSGSTRSSITGTSIANTSQTKTTVANSGNNTAPAVVTEPDAQKGFADLGTVEWAVEAINGLAEKGVISGRSDTEFAPNDNVTRAEFAKILVGAFGISTGTATADFSDVSESDWFYPYVAAAYELGIIGGYEDGRFGSNDLITRQDMAVMVNRAVEATGRTLEEVNAAVVFEDDYQIADYAKDAVSALQKAGIINGTSDTTFSPIDNATRAQAAKILYSFCD